MTTKTKRTSSKRSNAGDDWRWCLMQIWQGMTFSIWMQLLFNNRFSVSPGRWFSLLLTTSCSICNSLLRLLSEAIYSRRAAGTTVKPPLFIIGHWRTGTTLLHELLTLDDRFSFPSTFACLQPHHFLLTERIGRRLWRWLLPGTRIMDNMPNGADRPQEDEFALCNLGVPSPYSSLAFPNRTANDVDSLDLESLPPVKRQRWKEALLWFLKRLSIKDSRRLVLKSPTHTARIKTLVELFPDAQFVHIVRDPFVVFCSAVHTWKSLRRVQSLQVPNNNDLEEFVFATFEQMYHAFDRDRSLIDPENFYELRYEDLVNDTTGSMRSLYDHLRLGDFEEVRGKLQRFEEQSRTYRTNRYDISTDLEARITRRWKKQIDRWGYSRAVRAPVRGG